MRVTHCTRALLRAMADEMKAPASVEAEEPTVVTSLALQDDEPPATFSKASACAAFCAALR
jgi:hypothetical protein